MQCPLCRKDASSEVAFCRGCDAYLWFAAMAVFGSVGGSWAGAGATRI